MSHSYKCKNGTVFIFGSDSDDVKVLVNNTQIELNGDDLLEFIVEQLRTQAISSIKSMSTEQLIEKFL